MDAVRLFQPAWGSRLMDGHEADEQHVFAHASLPQKYPCTFPMRMGHFCFECQQTFAAHPSHDLRIDSQVSHHAADSLPAASWAALETSASSPGALLRRLQAVVGRGRARKAAQT